MRTIRFKNKGFLVYEWICIGYSLVACFSFGQFDVEDFGDGWHREVRYYIPAANQ